MKEEVFFKVEGEWLTNFFREYYWNGKHTYEETVEYIVQFLVSSDEKVKQYIRENVAPGILHGTKKLVGYNDFDLEDDNAEEEYHKSKPYREEQKRIEREKQEEIEQKQQKEYNNKWLVKEKPLALVKIKFWDYENTKDPFEYNYWAIPDDDFESEYGLIAPNGDYYSCDFAMHEGLAAHLVERDTNKRLGCLSKYGCKYNSVRDHALDYLQSLGWLVIRNPWLSGTSYPDFHNSKYTNEEDLPQCMLDTLYAWRIKHYA